MKKAILSLLFTLCCIVASAQSYVVSTASDGYTNIRSACSTNSRIIGEIPTGDQAVYLQTSGSWYKINYYGTIGYVHKSQVRLKSSSSSSSSSKYVYSAASDGYTNIRTSTSTNSRIIGELHNGGSGARLLGQSGNWYKINYNGTVGYVHKSQVRVR